MAVTYESASTRRHLSGRTETGRTLTPALRRWVDAMLDPLCGTREKGELLRAATVAHVGYMRDAGAGAGCDRHLLALQLLAREHNLPHPFLADPNLAVSSRWRLSTSQLQVRNLSLGFGPVIPEGYGVCYQIYPNHVHFSITCFRSDPETCATSLAGEIQRAFHDMMLLFPESSKL